MADDNGTPSQVQPSQVPLPRPTVPDIPLLTGDNLSAWSLNIMLYAQFYGIKTHLTGTEPVPSPQDANAIALYQRRQAQLRSTLTTSISSDIFTDLLAEHSAEAIASMEVKKLADTIFTVAARHSLSSQTVAQSKLATMGIPTTAPECHAWTENAHALYKTFQRLGMKPSWYTFTKPLLDNISRHPLFSDVCIALQRLQYGQRDVDIEIVFAHIRQVFEFKALQPVGHAFQTREPGGTHQTSGGGPKRSARDMSKYCTHHNARGHDTSECLRNGVPPRPHQPPAQAQQLAQQQARQVQFAPPAPAIPQVYPSPLQYHPAPPAFSVPTYQTPWAPALTPTSTLDMTNNPSTTGTPSVNGERGDLPDANSYYTCHTDPSHTSSKNDCYLDSAAYPTHTPLPLHESCSVNSTTLLADGSMTAVTHRGPFSVVPAGYPPLKIPIALTAPSFSSTLLSVAQLAETNDILFQQNMAFILPQGPRPSLQHVRAIADLQNGGYRLRLTPSCTSSEACRRPEALHSLACAARTTTGIQHQTNSSNTATQHPQTQPAADCPRPTLRPRVTPGPNVSRSIVPAQSKQQKASPSDAIVAAYPSPGQLSPTEQAVFALHLRLGHPSSSDLRFILKHGLLDGLPSGITAANIPDFTCSGCAMGKQTRAPFHRLSGASRAASPGQKIHSDTFSTGQRSLDGFNHFITFLDHATRRLKISALRARSDVQSALLRFLPSVSAKFHRPVQILHVDNAKEYFSGQLQSYYDSNGIEVRPTIPNSPQENSVAERINRTLWEKARAALYTAGFPLTFWTYAIFDAADKYNHNVHSLTKAIPEALWAQRKPDITTLLPFGMPGHVANVQNKPPALAPRALLGRYLRRLDPTHYQVWVPSTSTVVTCRSSDFQPYSPSLDPSSLFRALPGTQLKPTSLSNTFPSPTGPTLRALQPALPRTRAQVTYVARRASASDTTPPAAALYSPAPRNRREAQHRSDAAHWQRAWDHELDHLESTGTITFIPSSSAPPHVKLLPTKQFMTIKTDAEGVPSRAKSRCVVRGDLQRPYVHYDPDYISVATAERDSIRLLFSLALANDDNADHLDIDTAFPHERADPRQQLFVRQPLRFDGTEKYPGFVGRLDGNLYGTRQGSRVFGDGLASHLVQAGFERAQSDRCLFLKLPTATPASENPTQAQPTRLLTVTDDFLITGSPSGVRQAKSIINTKYSTKDSGPATKFNGWKVDRTRSRLKLSQPELARALLSAANMTSCNSAPTPYYHKADLSRRQEHEPALDLAIYPFRHLLGMLRHLADCTRPDLSYIVGVLAESQSDPAQRHWTALKRVVRYVKGTLTHGIAFTTTSSAEKNQLSAYADSDFAECRDTRRSRTGFVLFMNGGPVAWRSQRQKSVVLSTLESEYIALSHCTHHTVALRARLLELRMQQRRTPTYCDNDAALRISTGAITTPKRKYIDVHAHNSAERHESGDIDIRPISSAAQIADIFTKALPQPAFLTHAANLVTP